MVFILAFAIIGITWTDIEGYYINIRFGLKKMLLNLATTASGVMLVRNSVMPWEISCLNKIDTPPEMESGLVELKAL